MEKSLAFAALIPSSPMMPMPTSASIIIDTSFPPSPIAKVTELGANCFIFWTIWLFWKGDTLQHKTELEL